jgi:hypothetical protein
MEQEKQKLQQIIQDSIKGFKTKTISSQYNSIYISFNGCRVSGTTFTTQQKNQLKQKVNQQETVDFTDPKVQEKIVDSVKKEHDGWSKETIKTKVGEVINTCFQSNTVNILFSGDKCKIKNSDIFIQQFNYQNNVIELLVDSLIQLEISTPNPTQSPIPENLLKILISVFSVLGVIVLLAIILLIVFLI